MTALLMIAQVMTGITFFFFLPGYFLTSIAFKKQAILEKILLSVMFSIMLGLVIGIFFGYDRAQAARTGGFILRNLFLGEFAVTFLLAAGLLVKRTLQRREAREHHAKKNKHEK